MGRRETLLAMSGGVDSSTAAYLLLEKGYKVIGFTMRLWETEEGRCCSLADVEDARKVANKLGIPFYVLNMKEKFEREVVDYFCKEYARGRTPNPCIVCNSKIKFTALLQKKKELGVSHIATGHYAQVGYSPSRKRYYLKKGRDLRKDQSYMLFSLSQDQLKSTIFPLGNLTKNRVRRLAARIGLPVHSKKESQEICFISQKGYNEFLKERKPSCFKPGPILTREGKIIGEHQGIPYYTIGQRKRLGGGRKKPLYVTEIDKDNNAIIVGQRKQAFTRSAEITGINWVSIPAPENTIQCKVRIRYQHQESEATVSPTGEKDRYRVTFEQPQWAITPGQAAVFYQKNLLLGGGWIDRIKKNKRGA